MDIWKKYFNNNICRETKFIINDFEKNDIDSKLPDEYTIYYSCANHKRKKILIKDLFDPKNEYFFYKNNNNLKLSNDYKISNNSHIINNEENKEKIIEMKCYHQSKKAYKYKYYCIFLTLISKRML